MFVKNSRDCEEFTANDGCRIRELLHPKNDPVELPYSMAIARIAVGGESYRHQLRQTEIYYIQKGCGKMHINGETQGVATGDVVLIPTGATQWIENTGQNELEFIAIVSPPWQEEDDRRL